MGLGTAILWRQSVETAKSFLQKAYDDKEGKKLIKQIYKLTIISKNFLVYYCKCCNLIGYATRYLFVNGYRVVASNARQGRVFRQKTMLIPRFSK